MTDIAKLTNPLQCKEKVWHTDIWKHYRCSRKAVRNGFCWQHSPEAVKQRQDKREAKDKKDRERLHAPYKRMEKLEAELNNSVPRSRLDAVDNEVSALQKELAKTRESAKKEIERLEKIIKAQKE